MYGDQALTHIYIYKLCMYRPGQFRRKGERGTVFLSLMYQKRRADMTLATIARLRTRRKNTKTNMLYYIYAPLTVFISPPSLHRCSPGFIV